MGILNQAGQEHNLRCAMVDQQIKSRGISDQSVLDALRKIPREVFVPDRYRKDAYIDGPLPIGSGQTISQPYMVALMTECLLPTDHCKILEIGCGSGYQMAILLTITPSVYSIERIPELANKARETLASLGFQNPHIIIGDGTCGCIEEAPFDGIIVTAAAPAVPETLKSQLADGGRLVIPVGGHHTQVLYKIIRNGNTFTSEEITPCVFVPLIGKHAWDEIK